MISIDARFDALAASYLDEMKMLAKRAGNGHFDELSAGRLSRRQYANKQFKLAWNTMQASFLLGGGALEHGLARSYLRRMRKILKASAVALAGDLFNGRYESGGLDARLTLWVYTVAGAYQRGMLIGFPLARFVWKLGKTEVHCRTCLFYRNQRKFGWEWLLLEGQGILPQGRGLECEGWQCDCKLKRVRRRR